MANINQINSTYNSSETNFTRAENKAIDKAIQVGEWTVMKIGTVEFRMKVKHTFVHPDGTEETITKPLKKKERKALRRDLAKALGEDAAKETI